MTAARVQASLATVIFRERRPLFVSASVRTVAAKPATARCVRRFSAPTMKAGLIGVVIARLEGALWTLDIGASASLAVASSAVVLALKLSQELVDVTELAPFDFGFAEPENCEQHGLFRLSVSTRLEKRLSVRNPRVSASHSMAVPP